MFAMGHVVTQAYIERYGLWVGVHACWLVNCAIGAFDATGELPTELWAPRGVLEVVPMSWIHNIALVETARWIGIVGGGASFVALFRPDSRLLACIALSLGTVQQGIWRGFGFNNHAELPMIYTSAILLLWRSIARSSSRERDSDLGATALVAGLLVSTYSLIGVHRIVCGGWQVFAENTIYNYAIVRRAEDGEWLGCRVLEMFPSSLMSNISLIGFPVMTILEALAPVLICSRLLARFLFVAMTILHLSNYVFLGILFWEVMVIQSIVYFVLARAGVSCVKE